MSGPQFRVLYLMFEEQYIELAITVDEIVERILPLGDAASGTYKPPRGLDSDKSHEYVQFHQ